MQRINAFVVLLFGSLLGCGGGSQNGSTAPPPPILVTVSGLSGTLNTGASRTFSASVTNASNHAVTWSVVEAGGGTITQEGVYTAPGVPGTFTVKATAQADATASRIATVPVVIPEGHIPGYDVGVEYHAYTSDLVHAAFITTYDQSQVRQAVRSQLQGMADRGATVISTRIWFVTEPGTTNFGEAYRATFPMTDQEEANLRTYAQDVAAVQAPAEIGCGWTSTCSGSAQRTTRRDHRQPVSARPQSAPSNSLHALNSLRTKY